ncbi:hypothetical protein [Streptomyces sp. CC53]|uniref:hypothetical protein n=1 Tax=Streptomyces sp. CC53 TaxID=1906740 RepID=UPI000D1AF0C2|nr:hypothetical protein [Streptomyces sp. CC53]
MATDEDRRAAIRLADQAHEVGRASGRVLWREVLQRVSSGRLGRPHDWLDVPQLDSPWQDTISSERMGWRQRAANLQGEFAFAVDYRICHRCRIGWVEQPYTLPQYQRCGLGIAGLASLRSEHPDLSWHTLGGHLTESKGFWGVVGRDVLGGYQQRPLCPHVETGR